MIPISYYPPIRRKVLTEVGQFLVGSLAAAGAVLLAAITIAVFG